MNGETVTIEVARRLVELAYHDGWGDACFDHLKQRSDPEHPIGQGLKRDVDSMLLRIDPRDVLGLRGAR